jgi:putative acetyltransferase
MNEPIEATSAEDLRAARDLFQEYAAATGLDLAFQKFPEELNSLPGAYAPPRGTLLLARDEGTIAGCLGLRPFSETVGELKRLYVRPAHRGRGLAQLLVSRAIAVAERIGYRELVLDTLATMTPAIALYRSFGFEPIDAYYANPLPGVVYFRKRLSSPDS